MAENLIYVHQDHNKQEIRNFSHEKLAVHPTGLGLYEGRIWSLLSDDRLYRYAGGSINKIVEASDLNKFGIFVGTHDASTGIIPTTGSGIDSEGNPLSGSNSIQAGDYWRISAAGTITGIDGDDLLSVGDLIIATVDGSTITSEFLGVQKNIDDDASLNGSGTIDTVTRWTASNILGDSSFKDDGTTTAFGATLDSSTRIKVQSDLPVATSFTSTGSGSNEVVAGAFHTGAANGANLLHAQSSSANLSGTVTGQYSLLTLLGADYAIGSQSIITGGTTAAFGTNNKVVNSSGTAVAGSFESGHSSSINVPTEGTSIGIYSNAKVNTTNTGDVIGALVETTGLHGDNNYGLYIKSSNASSGDAWPLWVQDGNQGLGKTLISDANGKMRLDNVDASSILSSSLSVSSGTTTLTNTSPEIIYADSTGGVATIDLPSASVSVGRKFVVKRINAGTNTVRVEANGSDLIDNLSAFALYSQFDSLTFHCQSTTQWYVLA